MQSVWSLLLVVMGIALMAACGPDNGAPPVVGSSPTSAPVVMPSELPVAPPPPQVDFLPGLMAVPVGAAPLARIDILSRLLQQDLASWWRLDGRLTNSGNATAQDVRVTVRFYDVAGVLLNTKEAIVAPEVLTPGTEGHYGLLWPPDPRIAHVTLQPSWTTRGF